MICTNCYKAEYVPAKTTINKIPGIFDCMKCPKCGETIFTHEQSLMIDEKRRGEMTIEEAVALLKNHNKWRRGADIPMTDARKVGIAIDTVVAHHEAGRDGRPEVSKSQRRKVWKNTASNAGPT